MSHNNVIHFCSNRCKVVTKTDIFCLTERVNQICVTSLRNGPIYTKHKTLYKVEIKMQKAEKNCFLKSTEIEKNMSKMECYATRSLGGEVIFF